MKCRSACVMTVWIAVITLLRAGDAPLPYIVWDGHRFAQTAADRERDVRYFRDLGFTHSLIGGRLDTEKLRPDIRALFDACSRYGLRPGLRYGWDTDKLAEKLGGYDAMKKSGAYFYKGKSDTSLDFNPIHPQVINTYAKMIGDSVRGHRRFDKDNTIQLFLIGSERTWGLPKEKKISSAARKAILDAARADGVWKDGDTDWQKLSTWWGSPKGRGGDWRLRRAIAEEVRKEIPDALFMIDPLWAAKLPGDTDLGGSWSYMGKGYAEGMADQVLRLKAMCWPNPVTHSTQLIRGAYHDMILVANFGSLAVGADSLYHWGVHLFEPGQRARPWYAMHKVKRSSIGFPAFSLKREHRHPAPVAGWPTLLKTLAAKRRTPWGRKLWAKLGKAARRAAEEAELELFSDALEITPAAKKDIIDALNQAVRTSPFTAKELAALKLNKRGQVLLKRAGEDKLLPGNRAELNRLALEAAIGKGLTQTDSPNICQRLEDIDSKRLMKEPALRSTGRLIAARGAMLQAAKPLPTRAALLGGVYGGGDVTMAMIIGHLPFDLLRNPYHRDAAISNYKYVLVYKSNMSEKHFELVRTIAAKGGVVFMPKNFKYDAKQPKFAGTREWDPAAFGKRVYAGKGFGFDGSHEEFTTHIQKNAKRLRQLLHDAGFKPYFDSENLDVIMQGYNYKDTRLLFAVNNKRSDNYRRGVGSKAEFIINDKTPGLRVIDISTGRQLTTTQKGNTTVFTDTMPPAWYRIYQVLKPGQQSDLPKLPVGPKVTTLTAKKSKEGVTLKWAVDVKDWVGCNVQWVRIHRAAGNGKPTALKQIYARDVRGPGGLITEFVDDTAKPGTTYTYQIQTVTPLRIDGPLSAAAKISL